MDAPILRQTMKLGYYVTSTLNLEAAGVVQPGVYHGYNIKPNKDGGMSVLIDHDSDYPRSVAVVERNGYAMTIVMDKPGVLELPGKGLWYVCIDALYSPTSKGFQSIVCCKTAAKHHVILGRVEIANDGDEPTITPSKQVVSSGGGISAADPRLSDARDPLPHRHNASDIDGLDAIDPDDIDLSEYYKKDVVDGKLAQKVDVSTFEAHTAAFNPTKTPTPKAIVMAGDDGKIAAGWLPDNLNSSAPVDLSDYYTSEQVDVELAKKADASALAGYQTIAAANAALDAKADATALQDYYDKDEVDGKFAQKVDTTAFDAHVAASYTPTTAAAPNAVPMSDGNGKISADWLPDGLATNTISTVSIAVGKVQKLDAGSTPTVTNSGTTTKAVFDFGIPDGIPGADGVNGANGTTFVPSIDADGVLSWNNADGLPNPAPVNVKGDKGDKGDQGAQGAPGVAGQDGKDGKDGKDGTNAVAAMNPRGDYNKNADPAYAVNDYISYNENSYACKATNTGNVAPTTGREDDPFWQVMALQGAKGVDGKDGQAATIAIGTVTALATGANPTVTNTGNTQNAVLNFGLPRGLKGDKGDTGTTPEITVGKVTTLPAGSAVQVTARGTAAAPILDFSIPQGADADVDPLPNYSTAEQVIGKWVDGKPLYRKVYTNIKYDTTGLFVSGGIDVKPLKIKELVNIHGIRQLSTTNGFYPSNTNCYLAVDGGFLFSALANGGKGITAGTYLHITLEYTKTTD